MPNYDYQCQKCGHQFEIFQSMNDARLTDCPKQNCQGTVKRLIGTGAGIIFKGSGFYSTDYRSDSYKKASEQESKSPNPSSDSKSDTSTKSDKKPQAKACSGGCSCH